MSSWICFADDKLDIESLSGEVGFIVYAFGLQLMKKGDTVYLFQRQKKHAVFFGSLVVSENVTENVRRTRSMKILIGGPFTPHGRIKAEIPDERIRPFDFQAFYEAAGRRNSIGEIVRGNFELPKAAGAGQVVPLTGVIARGAH
jgi:hypothetical protein